MGRHCRRFVDHGDCGNASLSHFSCGSDTSLRQGQLLPQTDGPPFAFFRSRPKPTPHVQNGAEQNWSRLSMM